MDEIHLCSVDQTCSSCSSQNTNNVMNLLKKKKELINFIDEEIVSKFRIDSLNKRVKARFFKMIHQTLSSFVKIKLNKIPQKLITNVGIHFNKQFLKETIKSLYQKNVENFPSDDYFKTIIPLDKQETFFEILNSSIIESYKNYISCPIFENELKIIEKKNGKIFREIFEQVCLFFLDYYLFSKQNK